jgi:DNA polymerase-1
MNHLVFSEQPDYPIVFLVPSISKDGIIKEYITPFGLPTDDITVITLHYSQTKKKTPVVEMKEYIQSELVGVLENLQAKYLLVADTEYFKVLTGTAKADVNLGYVLPSVFGSFNVIYIPSYKAVFYDPIKIRPKIKQAIEALLAHVSNDYLDPGKDIIKFEAYPRTNEEIAVWIDKLLAMDCDLTIDIEAFSLKHNTAGIGSITFCWNQNEGVSFLVDYEPIEGTTCAPYGKQVINNPVRAMLIYFFRNFKRKAIYHHISYDVYVLIYQLFMTEILDTEGLLYGLDTMLANWEDTKLITYLATNSCAGNKLSLKDQAQAYAGNYAQEEINDITKIPPDQLLKYNLVDGLSTWYVHDKYYQKMIDDQQLDIYSNVFKPAIVDIIQMQLTGLPLNMKRVKEVKVILEADRDSATTRIQANPIIQQYIYQKNEDWVIEKNNTLKKKRVTIDDAKEEFNPGSPQQVQEVLFKQLGLPVIDLTKSKQPSTGKDTLKALKHHTTDPNVISLLTALIDFTDVDIILTTFITSMENAALGSDGWHYLFGNFNLGGTVSGRLSSSKPY